MEIIGYQLFIAFSLIVIRIFAPKYLLMLCYIWTGFTVLNLFFWPLIILQLFVVWCTYALISPSSYESSAIKNSDQRDGNDEIKKINIPFAEPKLSSISKKSNKFLLGIENFSNDLNNYVAVAAAVQAATSNVRMQISTENALI
jgi:hypothetical protein